MATFKNVQTVVDEAIVNFSDRVSLRELPYNNYTSMGYPKKFAVMHFDVKRYAVEQYGNVFTMYTKALGGFMQLGTLTFTPNVGTNVPLLLIDIMAMGKKRAAFIEYYDLTDGDIKQPRLEHIVQHYRSIPDYPEKPAWYVERRTPYSLIKGGEDEEALLTMIMDSVKAYGEVCKEQRQPYSANLIRLDAFVERMIEEGNPSTATMNRVLGKEQAEVFFRNAVMPTRFIK